VMAIVVSQKGDLTVGATGLSAGAPDLRR